MGRNSCLLMICVVLWHYMGEFLFWIESRQPSILVKNLLKVIIFRNPAWVCQSSTCISSLDLSSQVSGPPLCHVAKILTLLWLFQGLSKFVHLVLKFHTSLCLFILPFSRTMSHKVVLSFFLKKKKRHIYSAS